MGLFSGIKKTISKALPVSAGMTSAGFLGTLGAKRLMSGGPGGPDLSEDPRLTAIRNRLYSDAGAFRKGLPDLQNRMRSNLQTDAGEALKLGLDNTRKNFNRRGLLYSGLRQAGEQTTRGNVASALASGMSDINRDLENEAQGKEMAAAGVGLQGFGDAIGRASQLYDIRNQNAMERRRALGEIGRGVGYVAGSYYGRDPQSEAIRRRMMSGNSYITNEL